MIGINPSVPIYLYTLPCDMRRSFDGLCGMVINSMGKKPHSGEVFVFVNRLCTRMKILLWDRSSFWLFYRRLEQGTFQLPIFSREHPQSSFSLSYEELLLIIEGIDLSTVRRRKRYHHVKA
jgi:transposase